MQLTFVVSKLFPQEENDQWEDCQGTGPTDTSQYTQAFMSWHVILQKSQEPSQRSIFIPWSPQHEQTYASTTLSQFYATFF